MANYTYSNGYPNGSLTPSQNRPTMTTNNDSNASIWTEDHHGFNDSLGGSHKFTRLPDFTNPSVISGTSTQGSVIHTIAGTANNALPQAMFKDSNLSFHLNPIKAWAVFNATGAGPIAPLNQVNVSSISHVVASGTYGITLVTNAVFGTSFAVIVSVSRSTNSVLAMYQITGTGTFDILTKLSTVGSLIDVDQISFQVMQI